jgi:hypothetical protein
VVDAMRMRRSMVKFSRRAVKWSIWQYIKAGRWEGIKRVRQGGPTEYTGPEGIENMLPNLLVNLTRLGLNYERHIRCSELSSRDRADLEAAYYAGVITLTAYAFGAVRTYGWWRERGRDIFANVSDGGYVRVDLTSA